MTTDSSLVEQQLTLETQLIRQGVYEYRSTQARLKKHQLEALSRPSATVMRAYVHKLAKGISRWIEECHRRPAQTARAAAELEGIDPQVLALLTLRVMLNGVSRERTLQSLAVAVAKDISMERQLAAFEEAEPALYRKMQRHIRDSQENWRRDYRHRVMAHAMSKYEVAVPQWPLATRVQIGVALIGRAVETTGLFAIDRKPLHRRRGETLHVVPAPPLTEWMREQHDKLETLSPPRVAMLCEPLPWSTMVGGGYLHPVLQRPLARMHRGETVVPIVPDANRCPQLFRAVNAVQSVPWRVNRAVLDVALRFWDAGAELPGVCRMADTPLPDRPPESAPPEEWRAYKTRAREVRRANQQQAGRRLVAVNTLSQAKQVADLDRVWFPVALDFRGRLYSQTSDFTPQGHDIAKGLLEFGRSVPVTDRTLHWLGIKAANAYGLDKLSLPERSSWAAKQRKAMIAVAKNPTERRMWLDADEPWQFLSACTEIAAVVGGAKTTNAVVWQDGTANGLQHLAALARDRQAGELVNLVPGPRPSDVYAVVAARLTAMLEALAAGEESPEQTLAKQWLEYGIDRSVCKRPTMILPYGGTRYAVEKYTAEHVQDRVSSGGTHPFGGNSARACSFLATEMWRALAGVLPGPMALMAWTKKLARKSSSQGLPIAWTSPIGWTTMQAYPAVRQRRIKTRLGDSITRLAVREDTEKLDRTRQATALAPNWIHSLDASAMYATVLRMQDGGMDMACVHDAYGCHASSVDQMRDYTRQEFVAMHRENLVQRFVDDVARHWPETLPRDPAPAFGQLDIELVLESDYMFS